MPPQLPPYFGDFPFLSWHQFVSGSDHSVESLAMIKRIIRWIVCCWHTYSVYGQQICVTGCCARQRTCAVKNLLAESLNPWAEWTITWRNPYSPGVSSSGAQTWGVSREAVVMWTLKNRPLNSSIISCFCMKKFPHWALSSVPINSVVKSNHREKHFSTISILSVFWYTWRREWWCFKWWRVLNDECIMRVDWSSSSILSLTCQVIISAAVVCKTRINIHPSCNCFIKKSGLTLVSGKPNPIPNHL